MGRTTPLYLKLYVALPLPGCVYDFGNNRDLARGLVAHNRFVTTLFPPKLCENREWIINVECQTKYEERLAVVRMFVYIFLRLCRKYNIIIEEDWYKFFFIDEICI